MAKHVYSQKDIVYSEGFAPEKYTTADDLREHKRKRKKVEKGSSYGAVIEFINTENIMDFHVVVNRITSEKPDLIEALYEKWNMFKGFCDSRRYASLHGFGTISYDDLYKEYKNMVHDYEYIRVKNQELSEHCKELEADNLALRRYIFEVAGNSGGDLAVSEFWYNFDSSDFVDISDIDMIYSF